MNVSTSLRCILLGLFCVVAMASSKTMPMRLIKHAYHYGVKHEGIRSSHVLFVDFSKPSYHKRLTIYAMPSGKAIYRTFVAHGQGSGDQSHARFFSNQVNSHASSLGVYKTGVIYHGRHGLSMRLIGLEKNWNDHALSRGLVIHGAHYVNEARAIFHRVGRTWGCLGVPLKSVHPILNQLGKDALVIVYYPNTVWLKQSRFFH